MFVSRLINTLTIYWAKIFLLGIILFLVFGNLSVYRQKPDSLKGRLTENPDRAKFGFGHISSTKIARDKGNYLVAIRRFTLSYEDSDQIKEKKMAAIQLKSKYAPPVLNCCETYGFIGDRFFLYETRNFGNRLFIVLEQEAFNSLKNKSLIYFVTLAVGNEQAKAITDSFKNGEPKTIRGEKFGRLNKKIANKNPMVKVESQNLTKWLYSLPDDVKK